MELASIAAYDNIVIQCHDEPDADAFASSYGLYCYLTACKKQVRIIYGGRNSAIKPNLRWMKELLQIPVEYVTELEEPDLLIMADCQYGERNAQRFPAKEVCVIDHHQVRDPASLPAMHEIMENYGSCSTVVYGMLKRAGYDVSANISLQTALYYGLYMDTSQFQELWHPADKDMWDALSPDEGKLNVLKNTNIASADLYAIGQAFASHEVDAEHRFAIAECKTLDRNILGIVSDTLLQVDCIDACVVYAFMGDLIRFSARSCVVEIRADELVNCLAEGIGSAGGHMRKAAGVIFADALEKKYPSNQPFSVILKRLLADYFKNTDIFYSGQAMDLQGFELYRKLPVCVGVVDLNKYFTEGTKVMVRTLEGDIELTVSLNQLMMIGINDEVYPINRATFAKNYRLTGKAFTFSEEYIPAVREQESGIQVDLGLRAEECLSLGTSLIYARKLTRRTHVFTIWDKQKYLYGKPGDWIAVQKDHPEDIYIIAGGIFAQTYEDAWADHESEGGKENENDRL